MGAWLAKGMGFVQRCMREWLNSRVDKDMNRGMEGLIDDQLHRWMNG